MMGLTRISSVLCIVLAFGASCSVAEECGSECEENSRTLGGQRGTEQSSSKDSVSAAADDADIPRTSAGKTVEQAPAQNKRTPRTHVVRGEVASPSELKIPSDKLSVKFSSGGGSGPDRNPAIQLYMELMAQFQSETSPSVSQLLAMAVCHAYPRSKGAWDELARTELQLIEPNVYAFIRASLISAVLNDVPEWFDQQTIGGSGSSTQKKKKKNNKKKGKKTKKKKKEKKEKKSIVSGTLAALDHATEVARGWYEDGPYDAAIAHAKRAIAKVKREWHPTEVNGRDLELLIPLICEWKASGSHDFPPQVHKNPVKLEAAAPPIWRPDRQMPGNMLSAFVTPIYVVNLVDEGAVDAAFNARMAEQAIAGFEAFLATPEAYDKTKKRLHVATVLNDKFWNVQRSTKLTSNVAEVSEVMKVGIVPPLFCALFLSPVQ